MHSIIGIDRTPDAAIFPQVAASYSNLAGLLKSLNRLSEALPFARKALEIKVRSHPAHHPELAAAHLALAELLKDLAQWVFLTTAVFAATAFSFSSCSEFSGVCFMCWIIAWCRRR